jgi:hypothetical protein
MGLGFRRWGGGRQRGAESSKTRFVFGDPPCAGVVWRRRNGGCNILTRSKRHGHVFGFCYPLPLPAVNRPRQISTDALGSHTPILCTAGLCCTRRAALLPLPTHLDAHLLLGFLIEKIYKLHFVL